MEHNGNAIEAHRECTTTSILPLELLIVQLVTQRAFVPPYSWNPFASVEASLEKQVIEASHITTGSYDKVAEFINKTGPQYSAMLTDEEVAAAFRC